MALVVQDIAKVFCFGHQRLFSEDFIALVSFLMLFVRRTLGKYFISTVDK